MKMRVLAIFLVLCGIGVVAADTGHAQFRAEPWSAGLAQGHQLPTPLAAAPAGPARVGPSYERVVVGTTLGAVLGGAAGLGLIALTRGESTDANMFPWADLAAGTVIGSTAGMFLGARWGSGRGGNPWLTGTAAVGGTALGLLAGVAVGGLLAQADAGLAPEVIGTAIGVAIPLGLTSLAEWRTSH